MELYIGIEIGGTKLQLVTGNAEGKILERRRSTVDRTRAASGIQQQIEADLRELTRDNQPAAIGVGFEWVLKGKPSEHATMEAQGSDD